MELLKILANYRSIISFEEIRDDKEKLIWCESTTYSKIFHDDSNQMIILQSQNENSTYIICDSLFCETRTITPTRDQIIITANNFKKKLYGIRKNNI